jgi:hypothetical protein
MYIWKCHNDTPCVTSISTKNIFKKKMLWTTESQTLGNLDEINKFPEKQKLLKPSWGKMERLNKPIINKEIEQKCENFEAKLRPRLL